MKAPLIAYDVRELYKILELKLINNEDVRSYPKWIAIQIWSLEILGIEGGPIHGPFAPSF
jgi:hypothetical protein